MFWLLQAVASGMKDVGNVPGLAEALGGQLAFTRPMVENGFGDVAIRSDFLEEPSVRS